MPTRIGARLAQEKTPSIIREIERDKPNAAMENRRAMGLVSPNGKCL